MRGLFIACLLTVIDERLVGRRFPVISFLQTLHKYFPPIHCLYFDVKQVGELKQLTTDTVGIDNLVRMCSFGMFLILVINLHKKVRFVFSSETADSPTQPNKTL